MHIKKIGEDDLDEYNKLVDESIEGTIFHKSWWLNIFKNFYGNSYCVDFYGIFENDELVAGFPITIHNKFGVKYIYSPKITPYLGTIYKNKNIYKKCTEISWKKEINESFAKTLREKGICLYYSFGHNQIDLQPFRWLDFDIGVHYTYVLKLEQFDKVWDNLDRKRRNEINKCLKQNYNIRFAEIDTYIKLNEQTMRRQNHAIINEKLWLNIFDECKKSNSCEIFTIYNIDEALATLFLVWDSKRSYYIGGGIKDNTQGIMSFLIWQAMKYAKQKLNLNEFDFEGSDVRSIESYFRKFGGDIRPIYFISENSIRKVLILKLYSLVSGLNL